MNAKTFPTNLLVKCITEWYHVQVASLHRLPSDSGKHIYRVNLDNGARWVIRMVEDQNKAILIELAHLLLFLEQQNYPAERIVLTVEQTTIVTVDNWHLFMTTFLIGTPLEYTPTAFSFLGAIAGRLHALKPSLTYVPSQASMLPSNELAFAQERLGAIISLVPRSYITQYDLLEKSLSSIDHSMSLPTTLIHNDCHPANAIVTASGQVTLLDWEGAGMGPAILDVGFLLVNCDGKAPWDPLSTDSFHSNEELLKAVIEGYGQYYQPTSDELDHLLTAMRFRSLVFGACSFASAIIKQENAEFSQWWWKRYCAAEEITEKARAYFEHALQ